MQDCIVAHRHLVADNDALVKRQVYRDIVLNVGAFANDNARKVSTQYRVLEYRGIVTDGNVPYQACPFGEENPLAYDRALALVFYDRTHI